MRICFIDIIGLCYDGDTLNRRGLGGSESAVILMAKELADLGHKVTVFNDCYSDDCTPGIYDEVRYRPLQEIEHAGDFDIAISLRTVEPFHPVNTFYSNVQTKQTKKILWMHDTFCSGDNCIEDLVLNGHIDYIFTLSDWHTSYITNCDHEGKRRDFSVLKKHIFQTRNGCGMDPESVDPYFVDILEKDKNLFVYNASATKGMVSLINDIWPEVKRAIPLAQLKVIGGYYKFRDGSEPDAQQRMVMEMAARPDNEALGIEFTGVIKQSEISKILSQASFFLYPSEFPETYGISTLEAIMHNVPPITCERGALEETAIDIASYKIPYPMKKDWACPWLDEEEQKRKFIVQTINAYYNTYLHQQKMYACNQIKDIFHWETVARQWDQFFHKILGDYLPIEDYHRVQQINYRVAEVFGRRFLSVDQMVYPMVDKERSIKVIVPVYNAQDYIEKCIQSIASQDYQNYEVYIINDDSSDGTSGAIKDTISGLDWWIRPKFHVIENAINVGALENQIYTIRNHCVAGDIIMLIDGDDRLVNDPNIFKKYSRYYDEDGCDMTYGSCWSEADNIPLVAQEYPDYIKWNRDYKQYLFNWNFPYSHLRTFGYNLFEKIDLTKLQDSSGNYYKAGGDGALIYELLENCDSDRVKVVSDIVYIYNDLNPLNDYKVNSQEQNRNANEIRHK